ncbi:hypothetical protein M3484_09550 [Pseudomonas sp. GX19020]|uniref:hypothetical protein n=1 Tax=Pseudomonas sp. GX19020 TaxID=2942277 RepID=UPI002019EB91|nr:hypothetical protein [Pseudomonas sp. GX19020]MCL4066817.1 hypothetical protein [Pseudomonas sp. GX19020]
MIRAILTVAGLCATVFSTPAAADPDRVSLLIGSAHPGDGGYFDSRNPGVFLTWEQRGALGLDISAGIYRNSYGRASAAVTAALPLIRWEGGEASVLAGVALYPGDGCRFAVHAGDLVPLAGFQIRHRQLFVQILSGDGKAADAVIAAGITFALD